jgi:hypothetical protein
MKHAIKQLENPTGHNGSYKEDVKMFGMAKPNHFDGDSKKNRKGNIDALTGKRKYTKKLIKLEGALANSEFHTFKLLLKNKLLFSFRIERTQKV